ncbi:unnamed protein product, partial [Symbiodinium pilosum]
MTPLPPPSTLQPTPKAWPVRPSAPVAPRILALRAQPTAAPGLAKALAAPKHLAAPRPKCAPSGSLSMKVQPEKFENELAKEEPQAAVVDLADEAFESEE